MKKTVEWQQEGREHLKLELTLDGDSIKEVTMTCVGCLDFLNMSQLMKKNLHGSIQQIQPPSGNDHSSMIWREIIETIQEKWQNPVKQEELCHCRKVTTQKVDRAIVYGATTLADVRVRTSANTGCGTCKSDVVMLINNRIAKSKSA